MHLEPMIRNVTKAQLLEWKQDQQRVPADILRRLLERFGETAVQEFQSSPFVARAAFARATGMSADAIGHYTREGLLPVLRYANKFLYPSTALETAHDIKIMRELGVAIPEIRTRLFEIFATKQKQFAIVARLSRQENPDINDPKQRRAFRKKVVHHPEIREGLIADPEFRAAAKARNAFQAKIRASLEQQIAMIETKLVKLDVWTPQRKTALES